MSLGTLHHKAWDHGSAKCWVKRFLNSWLQCAVRILLKRSRFSLHFLLSSAVERNNDLDQQKTIFQLPEHLTKNAVKTDSYCLIWYKMQDLHSWANFFPSWICITSSQSLFEKFLAWITFSKQNKHTLETSCKQRNSKNSFGFSHLLAHQKEQSCVFIGFCKPSSIILMSEKESFKV